MSIKDIRNIVHVYAYTSHSGGATIKYLIHNQDKNEIIRLNNIKMFSELVAIGSLDQETDPEEFADYSISQWDALNIAIRHELSKETESELDKSAIGKAISNIKK